MGETGFFFKKALGTFLSRLQALTNCKVSEKSNERFSRNCVTDGRTNGRTDERTNGRTNGRDSLGLFSAKRRETKKNIKNFKIFDEHFFEHPCFRPDIARYGQI